MKNLTDDEFEDKVIELRESFKLEFYKAIGGEGALGDPDNETYTDAYSVGVYGGLSFLSTMAASFMVRLVVQEGMTAEDAEKAVGQIYHVFLHELLDQAKFTMQGTLQNLKNLKNLN